MNGNRIHSGNPELPMGLAMAMAENPTAMSYYSSLPPERQQELISLTHQIHSRQEMQRFVERLSQDSTGLSFF